ncbi:MAG: SpoIVB peptidase [Syntrophomonadaceae bacterium]|nr:SpoIVB peptidase [Bacillota bacterium]
MEKLSVRQKLVLTVLSFLLLLAAAVPWRIWLNMHPALRILEGEQYSVNIASPLTIHVRGDRDGILSLNGVPVSSSASKVNLRHPLLLSGLELGSVNLQFKLFGLIPLRELTVNVLPEKKLIPGGHSIGVKLHSEGVLVVGHHLVPTIGRTISPAKEAGIEVGDLLMAIDGIRLLDANQVAELVNRQETAGKSALFEIRRRGREIDKKVKPLLCQQTGRFRIGLYVRDSAAGVGTLTFYDPKTMIFGGLGHAIADIDTNQPIEIRDGQVVKADIVNIKAARRGIPGEKTGVFQEEEDLLGEIKVNSPYGIFGTLSRIAEVAGGYHQPIPIGLMSLVIPGPAEILTVIEGENIERFDIEIQRVYQQTKPGDKGMIIRITDKRLLDSTGGIVQGMSGSPIIQDGRLVGAVTHVFVNDPTRGYGLFIEWMIMESGLLSAGGSSNLSLKTPDGVFLCDII